jgi:hypothetical protein
MLIFIKEPSIDCGMNRFLVYLLQVGFFIVSIPLIYILLNSPFVQNFLHEYASK